jgi:hypothetical protein
MWQCNNHRWFLVLLAAFRLSAQVPGGRTMDIQPADVQYYRQTNRLYALLQPTSAQYPQSVIEIDPDRLMVLRTLPLPGAASNLLITDDGAFLYAFTASPPVVYHIRVSDLTIDATFRPLFSDGTAPADCKIGSLLPISGQAQSFVASFTDQWGNYMGVAAFDAASRRANVLQDPFKKVSILVSTASSDLVYGYDGLSTAWTVSRIKVASDGLTLLGNPIPGMAWGFERPLQVYDGLLYAANGTVTNVETGTEEGWFRSDEIKFASAFVIDAAHGLIYFTVRYDYGTAYIAQSLSTFLPVSRLWVENSPGGNNTDFGMGGSVRRLQLTNNGDLVAFDGAQSRLVFIPTNALPAYPSWAPPRGAQSVSQNVRLLPIPASFIAADPANKRLLATLQGRVPGTGNSLLTIDPSAGTVTSMVFAGAEPGIPAASSGGQYIYVPLLGQGAIRRIRTSDMQSDMYVHLTDPSSSLYMHAALILPLPDFDDSYAVIQYYDGDIVDYPSFTSAVVYDHDVRRPQTVSNTQTIIDSAALSKDGSVLFGLNQEVTSFEFSRLSISADGMALTKKVVGVGMSFYDALNCDNTLCATAYGWLVDGSTVARIGHLPAVGAVIADQAAGVVYVLVPNPQSMELREYSASTARVLRTMTIPLGGPVYAFCRWSQTEFAALTPGGVVLISGNGLQSVAAPVPPAPAVSGGVTTVGLSLSDAVYDATRNLIYGAVPGTGGAYGNELVAIDPSSGKVVKDLAVGSDPSLLRLTGDGKYLYLALTGGDAVTRVNLTSWEAEFSYPVSGSPTILVPQPGPASSFAVAVGSGPRGDGSQFAVPAGLRMYQSGAALPATVTTTPLWGLAADATSIVTDQGRFSIGSNGLTIAQSITQRFL